MALDPSYAFYSEGTISLTNGSDIATGEFVAWDPAVLPFDFVVPNNGTNGLSVVEEVLAMDQIRLAAPWSGPTLTDVPYFMVRWVKHTDPKVYALRVSDYLTRLKAIPENLDEVAEQISADAAAVAAAVPTVTQAAADVATDREAAATAASTALASINDFKGRWLGGQASDPTTDLLGNPVNAGDAYFNTASNELRFKNSGAGWSAVGPGVSLAQADERYGRIDRGSYLGQIATRTRVPNGFAAANKQGMCRTAHFARDTIRSLQLAFGNWYVNSTTRQETGTGGTASVQVAVEYPAGVFAQFTFGGSFVGAIASGATGLTDVLQINIPDGAEFWIRTFWDNPAGIVFSDALDMNHGEAFNVGASGIPNQVTGGTVTNAITNGAVVLLPCAILGQTTRNSICLIGDSRTAGGGDAFSDNSHYLGHGERSLAALTPVMNLGVSGDRAQSFIASSTQRRALAAYCSHVVSAYGINDLANGRTSAQLLADLQTIRGYFPAGRFVQATLEPWTTSTDAWATTANQTPAAWEAQRTALNDQIRAAALGSKFVEVADALESARNSGRWQPGRTADGVHANYGGTVLVKYLQKYALANLVA